MASIRIGIKSEFNLVDSKVGVGTTNPTELMDVRGQIYSDNSIGAGGISTVTTYQGFLDTKQTIKSSSEGTVVAGTLSGEIIIEGEVTVSSGTTYTSGLSELTATNKFTLPGITGSRPTEGTTRFNENLGALEFYTGTEWRAVNSYIDSGNRGRGLFAGGRCPAFTASIGYIEIATLGNSEYFGDLQQARESASNNVASSTRGLFAGGYHPGGADDEIGYVTIASEGNAIDFGNLSAEKYSPGGGSSSTRGIFAGGSPATNVIEYVEINTLGNAVDFGDLVTGRRYPSGLASPTRACFAAGTGSSSPYPPFNIIDYITIASTGNAVKFGELTATQIAVGGCSNQVRGLYHIGTNSWSPTWNSLNQVEYITIASEGNATNFGELTVARHYTGAVSSGVRGVFGGGFTGPSTTRYNTIDFVLIASLGNAQDFGDLMENRTASGTVCDSHGGLGGF